jgi:toxin YoeB
MIEEAHRDPAAGVGKPERPRGDLSGCRSRRITQEHRLVDRVDGENLVILQARYHY